MDNGLKDATYNADDLLDEIATIALRGELEAEAKANGNQVAAGQFSALNPRNPESMLKNIVERLDSLSNQRDLLNLNGIVRGKPSCMFPTTSLVDESKVFGREKNKEELTEFLLAGSVRELVVIAIVGIYGVGKTTIAQLLYNDSKVEEHFELRAWAYVSEEFDVLNITRTTFESITPSDCNVRDLNVLQVKLKQKLKGKRFLLVLDGIWNVNFSKWDLLSRPLSVGAYGSKIIVTTRNQSVASIMHAVVTYPLPHLSFEACWSLFAKHAFNTRNPAEQPTLKGIGEEIVKKCKGLPLATETLGTLLHSKVEVEEWHRILKSKIWDLPNDQSNILSALLLSYYHLPSHLKQCFAYCSIFPKGYEFEKEKLVFLWMAEGFLQQQKGNDTIEEVGNEYFRELLSWSFFQQSPRNK
ncbi:putative disease resistance RPP13-like protein 1 [Quercus robur]|uniref:putative disease resistance RPP13-like protein 1 n=1 Tax=Quercus robur TaxID=38942 RepID=UPI0021621F69|nr:putative disease resistance RPP13-like protein 1 [Quercus robur]